MLQMKKVNWCSILRNMLKSQEGAKSTHDIWREMMHVSQATSLIQP